MKRHKQTLEDQIKLFGISNQLLENDLDRVEQEFHIDLERGHAKTIEKDQYYYPQIDEAIRREASVMSSHYEIFYSLETSIRTFITDTLAAVEPSDWWYSHRVPEQIKKEVQKRIKREVDTGVTPRSNDPIDFTNFGELGEIIKANWDVFGGIFDSQKAVVKVMGNLNTLRAPIAHCSSLAEDEVVRLKLSVRDWFRLME